MEVLEEVENIYFDNLQKNVTYEFNLNQESFKEFLIDKMKNIEAKEKTIYDYKQNRVHKKNRINKKWLKKYGYKVIEKVVMAKEMTMNADDYPDETMGNKDEIIFRIVE